MLGNLLFIMALSVAQTEAAASDTPAEPPKVAAPAPDRWFFMQSAQGTYPGWLLDGNRIQISGWTNGSFTASSAANDNLPLGLNYRANEFLLQQNWLRVERSVITSGTSDPSFGFRSDTILPGSDYRFTLPRGMFNGQLTGNDGEPNGYGVDPVQFYVEAYFPTVANGLDIKAGRMFCQFGVEVIDAPSNLLASHSYAFFYNPFTHTGIMGTVQLTPAWSAQFGVMLGPDVVFDSAASPYGMFTLKWAPPNGPDSVLVSTLFGSGRYDVGEQFNNPNLIDLVYTHTINSRMTYTLDAHLGFQTNIPDIGSTWWWGLVNYLTCKLDPQTSATARVEVFDDVDGNRTGYAGLYVATTGGLNFKPRPWLVLRPELRFDYNTESRPFEDKHGLGTAGLDVIVRW